MKILAIMFCLLGLMIKANAHRVGNGGIKGVYEVSPAHLPLENQIRDLLSKSQLPATIKDKLQIEIIESPYLKADRDVKFVGEKYPGDWYIGNQDRLFYARTMSESGSATTLFPIFFTLSQEEQLDILIHEAIHRTESLAPNNISEDFVVGTTKLILRDVKAVESGIALRMKQTKQELQIWFASAMARNTVPFEKMHWVGRINIFSETNSRSKKPLRDYSNSLVSLSVSQANANTTWYAELASPIVRGSLMGSNSPHDFRKNRKLVLQLNDYVLIGTANSELDSIHGKVFESRTNLYAGEFVLNAIHDGGTGFGIYPSRPDCLNPSNVSISCYRTGTGTGTGGAPMKLWPFAK